jgi:hypothetical protein
MATKKSNKPTFRVAKKAQEAIRNATMEGAIAALEGFADQGDISAGYSLVELHAYREEWDRLFARIAPVLARANEIRFGNVTADAVCLLWLAARETKRWDEAIRVVDAMPAPALADGWFGRLARELRALAEAKGTGAAPDFARARPESLEQRIADWKTTTEKARAESNHGRMFGSAVNYQLEDEALELYPRVQNDVDWSGAVFVARTLCTRGKVGEAWEVVARAIPRGTWRVDTAQIAPARLVYDPVFHPLATKEHREWVLATPRQG